ncbi:Fic family protein [Candidatus Gottesmanbacteria bacterium]|nr:Fic family protein [Candidatus Gottesmanbacteria bacterium]
MNQTLSIRPFKTPFLKDFVLSPAILPLQDKEIIQMDQELEKYEQLFLDPEVEKNLITRNELLASFAISKAEMSTLTLEEAQEVYHLILKNEKYQSISQKLKKGLKLTQKDHDKLEFYNIANTFRLFNSQPFALKDLTGAFIQNLHRDLTRGLDIFKNHLPEFELYKSGKWRDNNLIRVGTYIPADFSLITQGTEELIRYVQKDTSPTKIAIFHTALYALHPFNNGNKRISRILEHLLLRALGLNKKNLYSSSYYYHKEKPRYYKYLLYSLERKNLNHFVSLVQEALSLSIVSVVGLSLQSKRSSLLDNQSKELKTILKPLVKRHELQFKHLFQKIKGKMARQTFVNYLQQAVDTKTVIKRQQGRSTYYSLYIKSEEQETISRWLALVGSKLSYIPDEIRLV